MSKVMILRVFGIIFVLLGVIGFVNHPVFGIFEVNAMHNIVHLVLGALALYFSQNNEKATMGGKILTVINALLLISMIIKPHGNIMGIEVNPEDHLLHLPFFLASLYVGFFGKTQTHSPSKA